MAAVARIDAHVFNVSPKTNWVFVAVQDDAGHAGWGEASLNGWEPVLLAALDRLRPELLGVQVETARQNLRVSAQSPGGLVANTVASALQQALVALQAAGQGVAVHALLGPLQRQRVDLYANINRATLQRTPQGFVDTALRAQALGFGRFKAAPFDGLTPALCPSAEGQRMIRHGIDCLLALRSALGPDALLMVDCHWRFDEARALQTLRDLAPACLHWFECPISESHAQWAATRRIRSAARDQGVLLAAAETQQGMASFQTLFDEALYDVVMPDVKYCGGPLEMLQIAQRAAEHGVVFSPHNPSGPVCTWHSLQVAAVAPECAMLELQFDESPLYDDVVGGTHLSGAGGAFDLASMPGLALSRALLAAHPYQPVPPGVESLLN